MNKLQELNLNEIERVSGANCTCNCRKENGTIYKGGVVIRPGDCGPVCAPDRVVSCI